MRMDRRIREGIATYLAEHKEEIVETLMELTRYPSVGSQPAPGAPYGKDCLTMLEKTLALCEEKGLRTENIEGYCGSALLGDAKQEIGMAAHLDVVPEGSGWTGAPYEPVIRDGYVVARGARDNKCAVVCGLYAFDCIRSLGVPMRHSLRLILGCAEETGMDDLPHYFAVHEAPAFTLVPDTRFPVCYGEKGIYDAALTLPVGPEVLAFAGGTAANVVPDRASALFAKTSEIAEKVPHELCQGNVSVLQESGNLRLDARGASAHASRPQGSINAIRELCVAALSIPKLLSPTTQKSLQLIADLLEDCYGERLGIAAEDRESGKLTCISGLVSLKEGQLRLQLNIRYPVTHPGEKITQGLEQFADNNQIGFLLLSDDKPAYFPPEDPIVQEISKVYTEVTGKPDKPFVMGGGTYARHIPRAVGFGPDFPDEVFPFPKGYGDCHQPDEGQSIEGLIQAIEVYIHTLLKLDEIL